MFALVFATTLTWLNKAYYKKTKRARESYNNPTLTSMIIVVFTLALQDMTFNLEMFVFVNKLSKNFTGLNVKEQ